MLALKLVRLQAARYSFAGLLLDPVSGLAAGSGRPGQRFNTRAGWSVCTAKVLDSPRRRRVTFDRVRQFCLRAHFRFAPKPDPTNAAATSESSCQSAVVSVSADEAELV